MDLIGYVNSITEAVINIDSGRKGFATKGKAEEGRVAYEKGIALAMTTFQQSKITRDPYIISLTEYTFITQEYQLCDKSDKHTLESLKKAIESYDDAFLALKAVEDASYKATENTFPHNKKYRIKGCPRDSFHIACASHHTRLQNILRSPGIDPIEKTLLKQRLANLPAARDGYIEKQKMAFVN